MPTRVLLALDKFKDCLTAHDAVETLAATLREFRPDWTLDLAPLADGGEGFAEILTHAADGRLAEHVVTGPRGEPTRAPVGWVPARAIPAAARGLLRLPANLPDHAEVAVVEMAAASGLALLAPDRRDPWQTTTLGVGELLRHAVAGGAVAILLGVGGSATHDLGLGALAALGLVCQNANGTTIHPPIPARWIEITRLAADAADGAAPMLPLPPVYIACDVANPLLGPRGAATVYGPQKGLHPDDLAELEAQSDRLARLLCAHHGRPSSLVETPGGGAAGGIAFGLLAACDARNIPGFDLVSAWLDLDTHIAAADIVVTGEGRFDESSLEGKGSGAIAARALAAGKQVHVFAGQIGCPNRFDSGRAGLSLHAITPADTPLNRALREGAPNLAAAARRVFAKHDT